MAYRGRRASSPARHGGLRIIITKRQSTRFTVLTQIAPQIAATAGVAQATQRLALNLAYALSREPELLTDLL
jgi:hypothetical protein